MRVILDNQSGHRQVLLEDNAEVHQSFKPLEDIVLSVVTSLSIQGHLIVVLLPEMLRSKLFASIPITSVSTSAIWLVTFPNL